MAKQPDVESKPKQRFFSHFRLARGWYGLDGWAGYQEAVYRVTAGTAVRRFMSARLPQDTSSGMVLRRSRSWSLLTKSRLDTHVTEVTKSTDPRKLCGLLPRDGKSSQGRAQQRKGEIMSFPIMQERTHAILKTISSSIMEKP